MFTGIRNMQQIFSFILGHTNKCTKLQWFIMRKSFLCIHTINFEIIISLSVTSAYLRFLCNRYMSLQLKYDCDYDYLIVIIKILTDWMNGNNCVAVAVKLVGHSVRKRLPFLFFLAFPAQSDRCCLLHTKSRTCIDGFLKEQAAVTMRTPPLERIEKKESVINL